MEVRNLEKNYVKLMEAYKLEKTKSAHHGKPSFGGLVHSVRLFFQYKKLVQDVRIEDWLEFSEWVATISLERHAPFLNMLHFDYGTELARHRENVCCHIEEKSAPGYWSTLKAIHKFLQSQIKSGKTTNFGGGYLVKF